MSFVLLGLHNSQFFLLDPFSFNLTLLSGSFLFKGTVDINSFVLVVFFEGKSLGLFRLGFFDFSFVLVFSRGVFLLSLFNVFILVEVIFHIAHVSFSSSGFSGFIAVLIYGYTLPVPDLLS